METSHFEISEFKLQEIQVFVDEWFPDLFCQKTIEQFLVMRYGSIAKLCYLRAFL